MVLHFQKLILSQQKQALIAHHNPAQYVQLQTPTFTCSSIIIQSQNPLPMSLHFQVYQASPKDAQAIPQCAESTISEHHEMSSHETAGSVSSSVAAIPLINLMLFFFQPSGLVSSTGLSKTPITNLGTVQDHKLFYIAIAIYIYIILSLIVVSCRWVELRKMLKLVFLVDHVMMIMLAADVTYIGLHLLTFSTVYDSNADTYLLQPEIILSWQDIVVMVLYFLTNLVAAGTIRVTITSITWKSWQVVILKLMVIGTSLLYFVLGLVYLFGKAPLDKAVQHFISEYAAYIIKLFENQTSSEFSYIPLFQNYNSSLKEQAILVDNFTVVYLIANFTFFFELVHKISEFDGTAELKTHYTFVRSEPDN